jgi:hypothetical protein
MALACNEDVMNDAVAIEWLGDHVDGRLDAIPTSVQLLVVIIVFRCSRMHVLSCTYCMASTWLQLALKP